MMNDEYRLTPLQPSLSSCQLTGRTEYSETSTASFYIIIMPRHHRAEVLSDDARLMSVCLSRTSGLSREQKGLGRLKLAQR